MSSYDVYGIGNALVDMEFEVEAEFLKKMNIEKGVMTLIDEKRRDELFDTVKNMEGKKGCGGSAANTIMAVAQYGGKSFYSCKVASDDVGSFYLNDLKNEGVHTNLKDDRPEGKTGKCMVFVTPDADRTMNTYLGITETFSKDELILSELEKAKYLYIEGYLVTSPTGKEAALAAKKHAESKGVKTAITFSDPAMVAYFKDGLNEMIGTGVDLLFCNESEALSYTDEDTIEKAAEKIKSIAKSFAITLGPKGCLVYDGNETFVMETRKVEARDSNGAGDIFAGSFLYAVSTGKTYRESAKLALEAATELVTHMGARLPKEKVQEIKSKIL